MILPLETILSCPSSNTYLMKENIKAIKGSIFFSIVQRTNNFHAMELMVIGVIHTYLQDKERKDFSRI